MKIFLASNRCCFFCWFTFNTDIVIAKVAGGEILWLFYKKNRERTTKKSWSRNKKSFCDAAAQPLEYELFQKICRSILADILLSLPYLFYYSFQFLLLLFVISFFFFISIFFSFGFEWKVLLPEKIQRKKVN